MIHLVKSGIPWEVVKNLPPSDMAVLLGVIAALDQREQEQQEMMNQMGGSPRF